MMCYCFGTKTIMPFPISIRRENLPFLVIRDLSNNRFLESTTNMMKKEMAVFFYMWGQVLKRFLSLTSTSTWPLFSSMDLHRRLIPGPVVHSVWFSVISLVRSVFGSTQRTTQCEEILVLGSASVSASLGEGWRATDAPALFSVPATGGECCWPRGTLPALWGLAAWHATLSLSPRRQWLWHTRLRACTVAWSDVFTVSKTFWSELVFV